MARLKPIPRRWAGNRRVAGSSRTATFNWRGRFDWVAPTEPYRRGVRVILAPSHRILVPVTPEKSYKKRLLLPIIW